MANYTNYIQAIFWWNCLEFSNKTDQTSRMTMFNSVKCGHTICLKFEDRFFTSLSMLGLKVKAIICSTIEENLPL